MVLVDLHSNYLSPGHLYDSFSPFRNNEDVLLMPSTYDTPTGANYLH